MITRGCDGEGVEVEKASAAARTIPRLYDILFSWYGPQGWWPLLSKAGTPGYDDEGYHPGIYEVPDGMGAFEIAVGAVLVQNTAWTNARRALAVLLERSLCSPERILGLEEEALARLIRPCGYYTLKARRLAHLARFFLSCDGLPERNALLGVWGVGRETADSILLYGYGVPVFVVDAYTRRIFSRLGLLASDDTPYEEVRSAVEEAVPPDHVCYNEFHALLVEHAKRFCRKRPLCGECPLRLECAHLSSAGGS
ncbi:endonuclease III domain-containing protein [Spirochaeta thermophila]|uniref:HhH-GPD domain-containing protein n=1 Tax=Winmispira thermophila (strain ATCC 49972 / DSM 6192 / RI 19.B1) TaxID=665571 RepID=E0RQ46_WINT6|nr:DNA repair protein [Spirochaeta thermophila]ADN01430.1 hypothetical protein STHERM_c04580 [Spirochaeta thermophila DSM 6192]